ncbi:hypothetical protein GQ600_20853 [Phytophthora cactorum]|nr:hypothetical protein GQ600_20853 [Phytophthora cactorum]
MMHYRSGTLLARGRQGCGAQGWREDDHQDGATAARGQLPQSPRYRAVAGPCRFQARAVVRRCTAPSARTAARTSVPIMHGLAPPGLFCDRAKSLLLTYHAMEEEENIAELALPADPAMLAKERSAHRAKMLLSSRVFFDGSMQTLFRMDSRSITALAHAVCPHFSPARDTPDAVLPSIRLAVFLFLCAHGATLEMTADRFAIRSSTVSASYEKWPLLFVRSYGR